MVSVDHVVLDDWPFVEVSVTITGLNPEFLKDDDLVNYLRAVCVLSIYDPSSGAMAAPPEATLETKKHWEDIEWYNSMGWDKYLRAEKVVPTNDTVFEFNLELLIDPTDTSTVTLENWSKTYLTYFTYIQIDTQQMSEDYGIAIAEAYKGMAGDYEMGVILEAGEVPNDTTFDWQDLRTYEVKAEEVEECEYDPSQATEGETTDVDTPGNRGAAPKINRTFGSLNKIEGEDNIEEGTVESNTMGVKL